MKSLGSSVSEIIKIGMKRELRKACSVQSVTSVGHETNLTNIKLVINDPLLFEIIS